MERSSFASIIRKGKDPELDPDRHLCLMDLDPDSGGQKHANSSDPDPGSPTQKITELRDLDRSKI